METSMEITLSEDYCPHCGELIPMDIIHRIMSLGYSYCDTCNSRLSIDDNSTIETVYNPDQDMTY